MDINFVVSGKIISEIFDLTPNQIKRSGAFRYFIYEIQDSIKKYVPKDTGALKRSPMELHKELMFEGDIVWSGTADEVYAQAVYNMSNSQIRKIKNPYARPRWIEYAFDKHYLSWEKKYKKAMVNFLKGR